MLNLNLRFKAGLRDLDRMRYSQTCFYTYKVYEVREAQIAIAERVAQDLYRLLKLPIDSVDPAHQIIHMHTLTRFETTVSLQVADCLMAFCIVEVPDTYFIIDTDPFVEEKYQELLQRIVSICEKRWQPN